MEELVKGLDEWKKQQEPADIDATMPDANNTASEEGLVQQLSKEFNLETGKVQQVLDSHTKRKKAKKQG
eukprot:846448-Prorocentrum_lima.AAC.1